MSHVSIGKRFLAEVRNQYEEWHDAFVREALQNCIDAPRSRNIHFLIKGMDNGNTRVEFENDGLPMSREEIKGKLLTLGESGKEHHGTVGGFGRAKELLYFCHESFEIVSGKDRVEGSGCEYKIRKIRKALDGTRSVVEIEGDHVDALSESLIDCVRFSRYRGMITLNGMALEDRTNNGRKREWEDGEGWCNVYTNRSHEGVLLVRVGGVFMFRKSLYDYKHCVVCELTTSHDTLTSNRDGLRSEYRWALDEFIESISTNRRSAFKPKSPKFRRYMGARLSAPITRTFEVETNYAAKNAPAAWIAKPKPAKVSEIGRRFDAEDVAETHTLLAVDPAEPGGDVSVNLFDDLGEVAPRFVAPTEPVAEPEDATLAYGGHVAVKHDFILRNELCNSIKVPVYYDPGEAKFSSYSMWLASAWAKCMVELHALFEKPGAFSIGFIFDEDDPDDGATEGMHETRDRIGHIYYIAPCKVERVNNGVKDDSRKLVPRWTRSDKWAILSVAAHEFVHGEGYDRHNEGYANRLTDVFGEILANRTRFNHCFRN